MNLICFFLLPLFLVMTFAQVEQEEMMTEEEALTAEPILCPSVDEVYYPPSYIDVKTQLANRALREGEIQMGHYYFAKLDESPMINEILKFIISENYTSSSFNHTLEFICGIGNTSMKLTGYQALLDSILADKNFSMSRGELFRLAYHLKTQRESFDDSEIRNVTNRFSQGIKAIVFEPSFTIKNIHDSYVFHFKGHSNGEKMEYWCLTGKCKRCNESRLVVEPNEDFSLFTLKNPTVDKNNCLGVKNNKAIIWLDEDFEEFCEREKWQIRFVGKTIAMIIYQPQGNSTDSARGFGLTRTGFNKKVTLESTHYLNSNQIWLTT